jgi:isochorismate pyruvate lyase
LTPACVSVHSNAKAIREAAMKRPEDCDTMQDIRAEIDRLDRALVQMLAQRAGYIDRAAQVKAGVGLPARIDVRVEEVVANVRSHAGTEALDPDLVEAVWRQLIDWSIAREEVALGQTD